jgi:hypothetical protein
MDHTRNLPTLVWPLAVPHPNYSLDREYVTSASQQGEQHGLCQLTDMPNQAQHRKRQKIQCGTAYVVEEARGYP